MNKVKIISLIAIFSIIVVLVIIFILFRLNSPDTYHKNALSIKETATTHGLNISINKVTTKDNICIEKDGSNCTNNFKSVYGRFIVINFTIENQDNEPLSFYPASAFNLANKDGDQAYFVEGVDDIKDTIIEPGNTISGTISFDVVIDDPYYLYYQDNLTETPIEFIIKKTDINKYLPS